MPKERIGRQIMYLYGLVRLAVADIAPARCGSSFATASDCAILFASDGCVLSQAPHLLMSLVALPYAHPVVTVRNESQRLVKPPNSSSTARRQNTVVARGILSVE